MPRENVEPLEIVGFEAILSEYCSTIAWSPTVKCCISKFIYASALESAIWRHAQSNTQGTAQVGEPPYGCLQVVVMMLPDSPGHFGVGAQEGLYVCLRALLRSRHPRRVTVLVLGTAR